MLFNPAQRELPCTARHAMRSAKFRSRLLQMLPELRFDNSYARLPERFFARLDPTPVVAPATTLCFLRARVTRLPALTSSTRRSRRRNESRWNAACPPHFSRKTRFACTSGASGSTMSSTPVYFTSLRTKTASNIFAGLMRSSNPEGASFCSASATRRLERWGLDE